MNITNNILQILNNIKKLYQQSANVTVSVKKLQGDSSVSLAEVLNDISLLSSIVGQIQSLVNFEPFELTLGGGSMEIDTTDTMYKTFWEKCILDLYMYKLWSKNHFDFDMETESELTINFVLTITGEENIIVGCPITAERDAETGDPTMVVGECTVLDTESNDITSNYPYLCAFLRGFIGDDLLPLLFGGSLSGSISEPLRGLNSQSPSLAIFLNIIDTMKNNILNNNNEK